MKEYMDEFLANPLFKRISCETDIVEILTCANAYVTHYTKGEDIIKEQDEVNNIGIVLSGRAQASSVDFTGKRFILAQHPKGGVFGSILSVGSTRKSPVAVTASEPTTVLHIPASYVLNHCHKACERHMMLMRNVLDIISIKYFEMHDRINCITKPTLREKILHYLNNSARLQNSRMIAIPFDREALAEYLNADRSALSRELSSMKKEGIIDYHKNSFKLLKFDMPEI